MVAISAKVVVPNWNESGEGMAHDNEFDDICAREQQIPIRNLDFVFPQFQFRPCFFVEFVVWMINIFFWFSKILLSRSLLQNNSTQYYN